MILESPFLTISGSSTLQTAPYFRFLEKRFCYCVYITWCSLVFQVVFAFAPGVAGAVWSNDTIIPIVGAGCELLGVVFST
jgi:hypothetical protein